MDVILFSVLGAAMSLLIAILCYLAKGVLDEMKSMNSKLIRVITNQEWHFAAITKLQSEVKEIQDKGR